MKEICINSSITENSKVHSLVHITSNPPFTESPVNFASVTALNIIVQRKEIEARHKMRQLLDSSEWSLHAAALCGCIFELYAIELLERGGDFHCRQLVGRHTNIHSAETTLDIPPSKKKVVDTVLPDQILNQLYVPITKTNASIDAWIPGIGAFQTAVGKKDGFTSGASDELAKLVGGNRLFWLIPPDDYHSFTKQSPYNIDQYALMIPYPK